MQRVIYMDINSFKTILFLYFSFGLSCVHGHIDDHPVHVHQTVFDLYLTTLCSIRWYQEVWEEMTEDLWLFWFDRTRLTSRCPTFDSAVGPRCKRPQTTILLTLSYIAIKLSEIKFCKLTLFIFCMTQQVKPFETVFKLQISFWSASQSRLHQRFYMIVLSRSSSCTDVPVLALAFLLTLNLKQNWLIFCSLIWLWVVTCVCD